MSKVIKKMSVMRLREQLEGLVGKLFSLGYSAGQVRQSLSSKLVGLQSDVPECLSKDQSDLLIQDLLASLQQSIIKLAIDICSSSENEPEVKDAERALLRPRPVKRTALERHLEKEEAPPRKRRP